MMLRVRPLPLLCVLLVAAAAAAAREKEELSAAYIVHVARAHAPSLPRHGGRLATRAYASFLRDHIPVDMSLPAPRVLYSYSHAATGFAARLTGRQAAHLAAQRSVLAVVPDEMKQLHTTLTPSFLGLSASSGLLPTSNGAADVVIGILDTGVYPIDRAAFAADPSLPPPPGKFRGACVWAPSFNASAYCNGKLVGVKVFYEGYEVDLGGPINETEESRSPLDTLGHGTHTASTAAGSAVLDASFYGYARGTAVGMAPGARIASYKVCWKYGCATSDILAAFDEAIADGVNVISASFGNAGWAQPFYTDTTAVGAFRAVRNGIIVSAAVGNSGPGESTANNIAPWFLTVGASTINRQFPADVVLGNGDTFSGASLYVGPPLGATKIPLVYGRTVGSKFCEAGKLNATLVAGKIVFCDLEGLNVAQGQAVRLAGGVGAILTTIKEFGELVVGNPHTFPATTITFAAAKRIKAYIKNSTSPVATIMFHGTVISGATPPSPRMASFSSRGPNLHAPEILKPDVTAPGVEILAAWTGAASPSGLDNDMRRVHYNVVSGTSMACPHVSGIAALLRQARPEWSPAAIKSALMTTAYNMDSAGHVIGDMATGKESTPFSRGAGHVDPNRAVDPGLVYDAGTEDYVDFLCALGYTAEEVAIFYTRGDGSPTNCSSSNSVGDHNYPAFTAVFTSRNESITQRRIVRNVGSNVNATYRAMVTGPAGVRVTVKPRKLRFSTTQETQEYHVTFAVRATASVKKTYTFGSIEWTDGTHKVTSPIAIIWPQESEIAEI